MYYSRKVFVYNLLCTVLHHQMNRSVTAGQRWKESEGVMTLEPVFMNGYVNYQTQ